MPMGFEGLHSGQFTLMATTTAVVETDAKTVVQVFGTITLSVEFQESDVAAYEYVVDPENKLLSVTFSTPRRDVHEILTWGYTKRMHFATNPNYYLSVVAQLTGAGAAILTICLWSELTDHGKRLMNHAG